MKMKRYKIKLQMNITKSHSKINTNSKERYSLTIPFELIKKLKWKKQDDIIITRYHTNSSMLIIQRQPKPL